MRRCPYCAEDIEDDASRCPHCGSQLSAAPATEAAPAPAAWAGTGTVQAAGSQPSGSVQFSHTGQRYLLGYDATDFGIWDRSSPGGAVERFPRSDDGWSQAWRRYSSLEPHNQPVQAAPPAYAAPGAPGAGTGAAASSPYGAPAATGPWQQHQQPVYYVSQQRRQNGMAVASLVLGIIGLVLFAFIVPPLLALIFGLVAMGQIRDSGGTQEGRGLAIAGVVLGGVGLALFVVAIIAAVNDATPGF
jgi:hypothetical protein